MNYTQFYKEVRGYASNYASRLFRDEGMRIEAVDKAMDKFVDWVIANPEAVPALPFWRASIRNSLINTFRDTPTNKNKNLKVRLSQITRPRENEIMALYSKGMIPAAIARGLEIDSGYVRKIVIKWTV